MRLPRQLLPLLLLCLATTTASAQLIWPSVHFGDSRDDVRTQLTNLNVPVESTPDGALQTNSDLELPLPGLPYPIPMMATLHFDTNSHLAEITLTLDLPAMRHDWASIGSNAALFNFAAEKLGFALASRYGAPIFSSTTCNATAETLTSPCTIQWQNNANNPEVIQLERIPNGRHLRIRYLPIYGDL